jgi:hypothetical protein
LQLPITAIAEGTRFSFAFAASDATGVYTSFGSDGNDTGCVIRAIQIHGEGPVNPWGVDSCT